MDERLKTLTSTLLQLVQFLKTMKLRKFRNKLESLMKIWSIALKLLPPQLREIVARLNDKMNAYSYPYVEFVIEEYSNTMRKQELYSAAVAYLGQKCSQYSRSCTVEQRTGTGNFVTNIADCVTVTDDFCGAQIWWRAARHNNENNHSRIEQRYYRLRFHKRYRSLVEQSYLQHVLEEGRSIMIRNRKRRLYTNSKLGQICWLHIAFRHPSTFETLAMDPKRKQEILNDLNKFKKGKEYYAKTGKAWKRGYLLYGPPGTGKSSMIAAIANYMDYDVYDLDLTTISTNAELRKLLIEMTNKSIIVIEDIDCSLEITGKREDITDNMMMPPPSMMTKKKGDGGKVTLSGLLNFIDGLWSVCGEERIIIFTTNYVSKLDDALIRAGRMDMHIEMSYCCFEAFKVLAKNYLDIFDHPLFDEVEALLEKVRITPADVAEQLMGSGFEKEKADKYLKKLIEVLEAKENIGSKQLEDRENLEAKKNN